MSKIRGMVFVLAALYAATLGAMVYCKPAPLRRFVGLDRIAIPQRIDGYSGADYQESDAVKADLSTAEILSRTYSGPGASIDFVMIGGDDRTALHDPKACFTGAGLILAGEHAERLPGADISMEACHVIGSDSGSNADMLYVYVVGGRRLSQIGQIRSEMLWGALLGRQAVPVYFLRFIGPLSADPRTAAAEHLRLQRFAAAMWNSVSSAMARPA